MLALRFRFHLALSGEQGGFAEPVEGVVHGAVYLLRGRGVAGHNEGVLRIGIENQLGFGVGGAKSLGFLVGHYRIFLAVEDKDGRGLGVDVEEWREEAGLGGGGRAVGPFPGEVGDGVEGDDSVGALPRDSAQGERQMAPGAVAGGDDALRVDAEFGRVAADPYEGGLDVFDGGPDGAEAILEGEAHDTLRRGVLHCRENISGRPPVQPPPWIQSTAGRGTALRPSMVSESPGLYSKVSTVCFSHGSAAIPF